MKRRQIANLELEDLVGFYDEQNQTESYINELEVENKHLLAANLHSEDMYRQIVDERNRLKAQINGMKQAIDDLVRNSEGVAGLHQNGDVAPWDELLTGGRFDEWLCVLDDTPQQCLAAHDAEVIENLKFPTMFRKMWSGSEVQAWLEEEANLIRQQAKENIQ